MSDASVKAAGRPAAPEARLRIKRIYDPPAASDGTRILIDRLWPRGVGKDDANVDVWLKEIAPSPALRAWFGHDPQRWRSFQSQYRAELDRNQEGVARLLDLMSAGPITLLYAARDTAHNHAVVLAHYMTATRGTVL